MRKLILPLLVLLLAGCDNSKSVATKSTSTTGGGGTASTPAVASVQLNWTASTGSPSGYYVEKSGDAGATYTTVATVTTNSALVGSLTIGHAYLFRVRGYNSGGYSGYSNVFTVTP
ncbi:MAG: fibronectin type III domain-containing protein [Bdellovibrionota bacterium]